MAVVAVVAPHRGVDLPPIPPAKLNHWIGIPPMLAGFRLAAAGSREFRRRNTTVHTFRKPDGLVTDGVFSFSRNPMYLGFALALLGFAIKLCTPLVFAVVAGFILVVDHRRIRFEERVAAEIFGEPHEAYRRATRRWI